VEEAVAASQLLHQQLLDSGEILLERVELETAAQARTRAGHDVEAPFSSSPLSSSPLSSSVVWSQARVAEAVRVAQPRRGVLFLSVLSRGEAWLFALGTTGYPS